MPLPQLDIAPALIDQVHDRILAAIVGGELKPGERLTQEGLADMLGVSRQPVSHALQILKRRGLLLESGRRGLAVASVDGGRLRNLYQVREALDGLAARLAAHRVAAGTAPPAERAALRRTLEAGIGLAASATTADLIAADVAFHAAIHTLSGNSAIAEMVAEQWPHFMRSMGLVLEPAAARRERIWREHRAISDAIEKGDPDGAEALARVHTRRAGEDTARRLETEAARPDIAAAV